MPRRAPRPGSLLALAATSITLLAGSALPAAAQFGGWWDAEGPLGRLTMTVRSGAYLPSASGSLFDEVTGELTLGAGDLRSLNVGAEVGVFVTPRVQLHIGLDRSLTTADSESRVGAASQQTRFGARSLLTAGVRGYVRPAFTQDASGAWVRTPFAAYVGAGVGQSRYTFEQTGAFFDATQGEAYDATYSSRGEGNVAFGAVGVEMPVTLPVATRSAVVVEARYERGDAPLAGLLASFDEIDLSGFRLLIGLQIAK